MRFTPDGSHCDVSFGPTARLLFGGVLNVRIGHQRINVANRAPLPDSALSFLSAPQDPMASGCVPFMLHVSGLIIVNIEIAACGVSVRTVEVFIDRPFPFPMALRPVRPPVRSIPSLRPARHYRSLY